MPGEMGLMLPVPQCGRGLLSSVHNKTVDFLPKASMREVLDQRLRYDKSLYSFLITLPSLSSFKSLILLYILLRLTPLVTIQVNVTQSWPVDLWNGPILVLLTFCERAKSLVLVLIPTRHEEERAGRQRDKKPQVLPLLAIPLKRSRLPAYHGRQSQPSQFQKHVFVCIKAWVHANL